MGVFEDKKLEQLDWMSQMTETIESYLNTILAKLPNQIIITAEDILRHSGTSYLQLNVNNLISDYIDKSRDDSHITWEEHNLLLKCFAFEIKKDAEIDLRTGILSGEITLVKIKQTFSDEDLQPLMGRTGVDIIGRVSDYGGGNVPIERLNEILDILGGCGEAMKNRSGKKKAVAIKNRLRQIFATNEWRIRDMTLANKIGTWIRGYIVDGNLADLTNLCKLKVMTHNNMPIYSVKEET
jgi:hypothetical protein